MVKCDNCGTGQDVRREFLTLWNGNIVDLCRACQIPLTKILDEIFYGGNHGGEPGTDKRP